MKVNLGSADKIIRIVLAVMAGVLGFYFKSWWGLIGIVPLVTVLISWCPIYAVFGIKTCKVE